MTLIHIPYNPLPWCVSPPFISDCGVNENTRTQLTDWSTPCKKTLWFVARPISGHLVTLISTTTKQTAVSEVKVLIFKWELSHYYSLLVFSPWYSVCASTLRWFEQKNLKSCSADAHARCDHFSNITFPFPAAPPHSFKYVCMGVVRYSYFVPEGKDPGFKNYGSSPLISNLRFSFQNSWYECRS